MTSLTPDELRALAAQWRRLGRSVSALTFTGGLAPAPDCASATGLLACTRAADAAADRYGAAVDGLGAAVHQFADLTESADAEAAAKILATSTP